MRTFSLSQAVVSSAAPPNTVGRRRTVPLLVMTALATMFLAARSRGYKLAEAREIARQHRDIRIP